MHDMNCEQARNLFGAYLDGDLSPMLDAELAAHRLHCTHCRHELALMQVAGHVIAADTDAGRELDEGFTDRLLACIEPTIGPTTDHWRRPWWIGGASIAAAAAAALAIAGMLWLRAPGAMVAGERIKNDARIAERDAKDSLVAETPPGPGVDDAADSLVNQVESTWYTHAESAQSLIDFGQITIMQILDQFGVDEPAQPADTFEPLPDSLDELAPSVEGDEIEDL